MVVSTGYCDRELLLNLGLGSTSKPELEVRSSLTHNLVGEVSDRVDALLRGYGAGPSLLHKARSVGIELLENALRHGQSQPEIEQYPPIFRLWLEKPCVVTMAVSNLMAREDRDSLDIWLRHIVGFDGAMIKSAVKHEILSPTHSKRSGTGIGLLSVVRQVDRLDWVFTPVSDQSVMFTVAARML